MLYVVDSSGTVTIEVSGTEYRVERLELTIDEAAYRAQIQAEEERAKAAAERDELKPWEPWREFGYVPEIRRLRSRQAGAVAVVRRDLGVRTKRKVRGPVEPP